MLAIKRPARWSYLVLCCGMGHPSKPNATGTVHTIALMPLEAPPGLQATPGAAASFDSLIGTTLRAEGFAVFPRDSTIPIWVHVRDSAGGFYDTYTGRIVESKRQAVIASFRFALRADHRVDALLYPEIREVHVSFKGSTAKWSGVEETTGGFGGLFGHFQGGLLAALTLFVKVVDPDGKELYSGEGGIQLTQRVRKNTALVVLPPDSILSRGDRNSAAVHLALDSLPAHVVPKTP